MWEAPRSDSIGALLGFELLPGDRTALLVLALWLLVGVAIVMRPRRRTTPSRDDWYAVEHGPPAVDRSSFDAAHRRSQAAPASVVAADALPAMDALEGHRVAALQLYDGVAPVLCAGRRPFVRDYGALLLCGPRSDAIALVRAVTGEVGGALLVLRTSDFARSGTDSAIEDVFAQAIRHAPCVVLLEAIDACSIEAASTRRRLQHDLVRQVRGLAGNARIAVIGLAEERDALPASMCAPGAFDRVIVVGTLTREERDRLIRREALLHGMTVDVVAAAVEATAGLTADELRRIVAVAAAEVRARGNYPGGSPVLSARDIRVALSADGHPQVVLDSFGADQAQALRDAAKCLREPDSGRALVLLGTRGNGRTTAAHWVAGRSGRRVVWLDAEDLVALGASHVDTLVARAADEGALIVLDDIDDALAAAPRVAARHLVIMIERVATAGTIGMIVTAERAWLPPGSADLAQQADVLVLTHPSFHERTLLIGHVRPSLNRNERSVLAAALHGASRGTVVDAAMRADPRPR